MQAFKRCPKGHIYRSTFARCPYCDGSISGYGLDNQTMLVDWEDKRPEGQERTVLLDKVEYWDSLPEIKRRLGGSSLLWANKGLFEVAGFGRCYLYLDTRNAGCCYLHFRNGVTVFCNYPDSSRTRSLHKAFQACLE